LWASIGVAITTIALKTLAWYVTDSVGLLSDAMESFVNLASAIFALMMVTIAQRPADHEHPYGHHKAEYFSSGFEGILIVGVALGIVWAAASRLFSPQPLQELGWGLALSVLSSALNGLLALVMFSSAKLHRSIALEADARHLVTDVWTSAGVVAGLIGVALTGWP
jgi:cation diffusion facilitator family transporter